MQDRNNHLFQFCWPSQKFWLLFKIFTTTLSTSRFSLSNQILTILSWKNPPKACHFRKEIQRKCCLISKLKELPNIIQHSKPPSSSLNLDHALWRKKLFQSMPTGEKNQQKWCLPQNGRGWLFQWVVGRELTIVLQQRCDQKRDKILKLPISSILKGQFFLEKKVDSIFHLLSHPGGWLEPWKSIFHR